MHESPCGYSTLSSHVVPVYVNSRSVRSIWRIYRRRARFRKQMTKARPCYERRNERTNRPVTLALLVLCKVLQSGCEVAGFPLLCLASLRTVPLCLSSRRASTRPFFPLLPSLSLYPRSSAISLALIHDLPLPPPSLSLSLSLSLPLSLSRFILLTENARRGGEAEGKVQANENKRK